MTVGRVKGGRYFVGNFKCARNYARAKRVGASSTNTTSNMGRNPTGHAKLSFPGVTGVLVACYVINVYRFLH